MSEERKNGMYQCQVCKKFYMSEKGMCSRCGADLKIFGKWIEDEKPVGKRIVKKILIIIGTIIIGLFVSVLVYEMITSKNDQSTSHIVENDDSQEDDISQEENGQYNNGNQTGTSSSEQTSIGNEEQYNPKNAGKIMNNTEKMILTAILYPTSEEYGKEILGGDVILPSGGTADIINGFDGTEGNEYYITVITESGEVLKFKEFNFESNDFIIIEEADQPYLRIMKPNGTMSVNGIKRLYSEMYNTVKGRTIPVLNGTKYDFPEVYIYPSGSDDKGANLAQTRLKDGVMNSYDPLKSNIKSDTRKDIYFVDSEGDGWLYENVDFSKVYCAIHILNEKGQPELNLMRSDEDIEIVSGYLYEGK